MKPRSAKAKGRRFQTEVRDLILESFPILEPDDVKGAIMGESGEDVKLSPAARKLFPYAVECKNTEKLNIWSALEQSAANAKNAAVPLVFFKRNRSKSYVAMEAEHFFELLKQLDNCEK
jgi:hypothetical protein